MTADLPTADRAAALRRFNRFYTRRIGALGEGLLDTPFSLAESRLLWELAHRDGLTAAELARALELDPGYLSRLLRGFKSRGLVGVERSPHDARHQRLRLSASGRRAFAPLDAGAQAQAEALLATLTDAQQQQLVEAAACIGRLLGDNGARAPAWLLRPHRPGDLGWIVARHGALYAAEYGWDGRFEALVARIAADFIERFDPAREACWIAERDGANAGSVMLVRARDADRGEPIEATAQLRLLLVEPAARGAGVGARLVDACERFARQAGYRRIVLWTNSNLVAARAIYRKAGYVLTGSEPHRSFGHDLVGETWERTLA